MLGVLFESTIPVSERPRSRSSDRVASVIDIAHLSFAQNFSTPAPKTGIAYMYKQWHKLGKKLFKI
jgi:hypothetical protein